MRHDAQGSTKAFSLSTLAQVVVRTDGPVPIAVITGEIDLSNARETERALRLAGENGLVVDLTATVYIDSAALRALLAVATAVRGAGHRFCVVASDGTLVRRVFELAEVDAHLGLVSDIDQAVS